MAYSNAEVIDYLIANPNMSDAEIVSAMETFSISPAQMAKIAGVSEGEIAARVADTLPPNQAVLLGDTYVQAVNSVTGSGQDQQVGGLENVITYKADENKVGGGYNQYTPTGELERTGTQQEVNANKDFMNFVLTAATMGGLPAGIGESLGLTGATGQAVGQGLLTTGTRLGSGEDLSSSLKAGLLGGALSYGGSALSDYVSANMPVNASNMTQAQFNDAIEGKLVSDLQSAGLSKDQINAFLDDMGIGQGLTTPTTQVATTSPVTDGGGITITAPTATPSYNMLNTVTGLLTPPLMDTVNVTGAKPQQVSQDVLDAVTAQLVSNQSTVPTVNITGQKPTTINDVISTLITTGLIKDIPTLDITSNRPITSKTDLDSVITSLITSNTPITTTKTTDTTIPTIDIIDKKPVIGDTLSAITTIPSTLTTTTETPVKTTKEIVDAKKDTTLTTSDIIKLISVVPAIAAITKIATPTTIPPTGFDVVPIPASFGNPPAPSVAPYSPLAPINFGTRNLLKGTQWEKFLDPNYGQVPTPVQYSQPSNLSYNDLMGILGSRQGMPSRSNLSINDVISGIQNQYGQAPTGTMG
jgi:hypothetical protein